MFENLTVAMRVLLMPIRALWTLYQWLWWAFDDVPGMSAPKAGPDGVRPEKPVNQLKAGFAWSTIAWLPAAYGAGWMNHVGWISEPSAVFGTMWTAAALWVISLFGVRRAYLKAKREATPAATPAERVRRMFGAQPIPAPAPASPMPGFVASEPAPLSRPRRFLDSVRKLVPTVRLPRWRV